MRQPSQYRPRKCSECGSKTHVINGLWLRWLREHALVRMSLRAFARKVKLSAAYVSDIERNQRGCPYHIQCAYESIEVAR